MTIKILQPKNNLVSITIANVGIWGVLNFAVMVTVHYIGSVMELYGKGFDINRLSPVSILDYIKVCRSEMKFKVYYDRETDTKVLEPANDYYPALPGDMPDTDF